MKTTKDIVKNHMSEKDIADKKIQISDQREAQEIILGKKDLTSEQKELLLNSVKDLNVSEELRKELVKHINSCCKGMKRILTSEQRKALECFYKFTNIILPNYDNSTNYDNSRLLFIIYALYPLLYPTLKEAPVNLRTELHTIIRENRPVLLKKMKCNWLSKTEEIEKYISLLLKHKILLHNKIPYSVEIKTTIKYEVPTYTKTNDVKKEIKAITKPKTKSVKRKKTYYYYSLNEGITDLFGYSCEDIYKAVLECKKQGFFYKKKIPLIFDYNVAKKF